MNDILIYETIYLVIISFSIAFLVYIALNVKSGLLKGYYITILSIIMVALFSDMLIIIATSVSFIFTLLIIKNLLLSIFGVVMINFIYYYNKGTLMNPVINVFLSILPIATFLIVVTNPIHYMVFSRISLTSIEVNSLYYVLAVGRDLYLFASLLIFLFTKKLVKGDNSKDVLYFLFMLIIIALAKIYYFYFGQTLLFNLTIALSNIAVIIFGYIIFVSRYFNIESYGIDRAINTLREGVVILNVDKKILAVNKSFEELVNKAYKDDIIDHYDLLRSYQYILEKNELLPDRGSDTSKNMDNDFNDDLYINVIESAAYNKKDELSGYILIFRDISEYINIQDTLQYKNVELTKTRIKLENHINDIKTIDSLEKRSKIAKDVHDILGHTLTVTNLKLQYCIDKFDEDTKQTEDNIEEIKDIVEKGITQLSHSIDAEEVYETVSLLRLKHELNRLSTSILPNGINLEVTVKGIYKMVPVKYYNAIFRICQEAVTNAIKHSEAENIYIIIRDDNKKIDINIFDDGIGCNLLKRGNGLSGMEQRVRELGGSIKFTSVGNEGFYIKASIEVLTESNKKII